MASPYLRLRVLGTLSSGDTWSVNPCFAVRGSSATPTQDLLDRWTAAVGGLHTGAVLPDDLRAVMSNAAKVTGVRGEWHADGTRLSLVSEFTLSPAAGGTGAAVHPAQTALVTTLATAVPSRSTRGRLYWPALAVQIDPGTLRVSSNETDLVAEAAAAWVADVADAWPTPGQIDPVVHSQTHGTNQIVTAVRVGDVPDNQSRRRDGMAENYRTEFVTRSA